MAVPAALGVTTPVTGSTDATAGLDEPKVRTPSDAVETVGVWNVLPNVKFTADRLKVADAVAFATEMAVPIDCAGK